MSNLLLFAIKALSMALHGIITEKAAWDAINLLEGEPTVEDWAELEMKRHKNSERIQQL